MNPWVLWCLIGAQVIADMIILLSFDDHSTRLVKLESLERIRTMRGRNPR